MIGMRRCIVMGILLGMTISAGLSLAAEGKEGETPEQRSERMKWWHDAKFGMFVHWGVYSVPAGRWNDKEVPSIGEWIMNTAKIPMKNYQALTAQFNPVKYDADAWVQLAKDAGMKYIVITSKHHDGFAMFRSAASPFNIYDATPFKRDPLKELADACRKHGIKLGFYYSQAQDWNHPGGAAIGGHWDKGQDGSYDDFIKNVDVPQIRELFTNYGDIAVLWWDTPIDMTEARQQNALAPLQLQPRIITNDRLGGHGDFTTPEQYIPENPPAGDWETCMTMNNTWGYKVDDNNWKSATELIRNLVKIASKGGNFLLNVGPTSLGEIPGPSIERLKEIGIWMKSNGQSVYGTTRSPFRRVDFEGAVTVKGDKMFLHVFEWPKDGAVVRNLVNKVNGAKFFTSGAKADYQVSVDTAGKTVLTVKAPEKPDAVDTVVEVSLDGPPKAEYAAVEQKADGPILLRVADARFTGSVHYDLANDCTARWLGTPDVVSWDVKVAKAGAYRVEVSYAWYVSDIDSEFSVGTEAGTRAQGKVADTGSWTTFKSFSLGNIDLKAGPQVIDIKAQKVPHGGVMNLREIRLEPVKPMQ